MEENTFENMPRASGINSQKQIAGAIILAGMIIAGAILLKGNMAPGQRAVSENSNIPLITTEARPVSANDHIIGSPDAEVVIIEYSDTECPFCKVFHTTLHNVVEKNNGKVAWVYRHYPIPQLHPKAFHEAEATECAWEQGGNEAFWKYTDEVFTRTQSNNKLDEAELPKIAKDIGLDLASFNACLSSNKHAAKIEADMEDGNKAGASGTPFSLVVAKKNISDKTQKEIIDSLNAPGAVSFDSKNKNIMSLNGALPLEMVNKILAILLK